jgi:hypothetical protein
VQGVDRSKLLLRGCCQPYMAWAFIMSFTIILVFNGFTAFLHQFSVSDFFASYITLPVFGLCWIVFRLVKKDVIGMASLEDIDLSKTDRSRRSERRGMTSQLHMPWCNRLSKEKGRALLSATAASLIIRRLPEEGVAALTRACFKTSVDNVLTLASLLFAETGGSRLYLRSILVTLGE